MEFNGQYLTYDEYKALGGSLDQTPFNLLEFEAQKIIDSRTLQRLKGIKELPKEVCDIERVTFYMAQSYISAMVINGYYDYFEVPFEDLDYSHPWIKSLVDVYERSFVEGARITTYQSMARMQRMRLGMDEYESLPIDTLSIKGFFESKMKKEKK